MLVSMKMRVKNLNVCGKLVQVDHVGLNHFQCVAACELGRPVKLVGEEDEGDAVSCDCIPMPMDQESIRMLHPSGVAGVVVVAA